jgi:hypothetical protein
MLCFQSETGKAAAVGCQGTLYSKAVIISQRIIDTFVEF